MGRTGSSLALNSTPTLIVSYVDANKIDQRPFRGDWCNQEGAGIGSLPQAYPYGTTSPVQAFVWIKPPGESDGTSAPTPNPNPTGKKSDPMCSPTYITSAGNTTGAMPDSPLAGAWFGAQFEQLIKNAYPPIAPAQAATSKAGGN